MNCCHGTRISTTDPRFEGDDFTEAAGRERRARAAHAHGAAFLLSLIGAVFFFGLMKSVHRTLR